MAPYFEYCALCYLNQWLSREQALHWSLRKDSCGDRLAALREASAFFGVAWTLPTSFDQTTGRLEPVLTVLEKPEYSVLTEGNLVQMVSAAHEEISRQYGKRTVLSATTKFLWLKHRYPVIIYDRYVTAALKVKAAGYRNFVYEWRHQYRRKQSEIEEVCLKLAGMHRYNVKGDLVSEQDIEELCKQTWFHQRVFDIYLWHYGKDGA